MAKQKSPEAEPKKTPCPISAADFAAHAPALTGQVANGSGQGQTVPLILSPKTFSTGSFGWHANEKMTMVVNGVAIKVQANLLLTVVGSKDATK